MNTPHIPDSLISPEYLELQKELHARPNGYGGGGYKHSVQVASLAAHHQCRTVLDYGCGRGTLAQTLRNAGEGLEVHEYDPAICGKEHAQPADLVVCTDVLEHIEPEKLDAVLAHLFALTRRVAYLVIATRPANKTLADGRNAHLIIEGMGWWHERLSAHWASMGISMQRPPDRSEITFWCYS